MFNFEVKSLSESDSDSAIAIVKAVMAVDDEASVYVRMGSHRVEVTSESAGASELLTAISDAGFAAVLVPDETNLASASTKVAPRRTTPKVPFEPDGTEFDSGDA